MKRFIKFLIVASAVLVLSFSSTVFAAAQGDCPPVFQTGSCKTNSFGSGQGFQITGTLKDQHGQYAAGTRVTFEYNSAGAVQSTKVGGQTITLSPAGTPAPPSAPTTSAPQRSETQYQEDSKYCTEHASEYTGGVVGCMASHFGSFAADTAGSIFADWVGLPFMWWVLSLTAYLYFIAAQFLLWFGTTFFDNVIYYLVINMGVFIQNANSQSGIQTAWVAIRDLMNIGIIAGFIIVGISTILQTQQYSANRFLARLIIAALLVNFSYFFAGAVIDASNFITKQIYTSKIVTGACTEKITKNLSLSVRYTVTGFVPPSELCSMSASFMEILKFGSWTDIKNAVTVSPSQSYTDWNKRIFFVGMLGGLFYAITGFVFFSAAILLLGRFVVLILLLITSPVGVAGINIPYIDEYAKKWWGMLISQSFFAPIFVLLVGIGLTIISGLTKTLKTGGMLKANYAAIAMGRWEEAVNSIPIFIAFFVGIALLYAALQIARSMSESGKEYVGAIYGGLQNSLGSVYGDLYQATAARALAIPSTAYDATLGQMAKVPYVGQYLTFVGQALRPNKDAKPFGASKSYAESQKETQEYLKSLPNTASFLDLKDRAKDAITMIQNAGTWLAEEDVHKLIEKANEGEELTPAQRRKVERYVQSLKDEDIEHMTHDELAEIAPFMTVKQFKKTMDRPDLNDSQRKVIQDSRWAEIKRAKDAGLTTEAAKLIDGLDKTERKILFAERDEVRTDKQILAALNAKTYDEVINDDSLYGGESEEFMKDTKAYRANQVANNPGKMSETDAKHIKSGDVTPETINTMTPAQARKLYTNSKDATLRARLASRFPELAQPGPAEVAAAEDAEKKKKEDAERAEQEAKEKEDAEAEEKKKQDKK